MEKVSLGPRTFLYPLPVTLMGAMVGDRPNFLTVAYCGIVQRQPPMIVVSLGRTHFTEISRRAARYRRPQQSLEC